MTAPRILFVCAAGARIGGGHVMRSLTLAGALEALGAACAFLSSPEVDSLLDAFAPDMARAAATDGFDALVFDSYALTAEDHRVLAGGRVSLVIDDLADRPLAADLVLDSGLARRPEDYAGLVPADARLLLGPDYAPVRPAFAALRDAALARRAARPPVERILVSLGLTDVGGITARVVDLLRPVLDHTRLDVVLGRGAPSLPGLAALAATDARLTLHVDSPHMPELTLGADLAIGAGGSSAWERCVLALPSLTLVLADNQIAPARALEAAGAAPCLAVDGDGFDAALVATMQDLMKDADRRAALSVAGAKVCDGRGAERVAHVLRAML